MNEDVYLALVAYGLHLLGQATSKQKAAEGLIGDLAGLLDKWQWEAYEESLGHKRSPEKILSSIFSQVALPDQEEQRTLPQTAYHVARPLALKQETLFPLYAGDEGDEKRLATLDEAQAASDLSGLWEGFAGEYKTLWERFRQKRGTFFETFYHLMYRHAWALPCTYGEEGVSLFEQWKAVAAMAHASGQEWAEGPAANFTLVGGDIPGIQDFVYTITSKGAAKGLRGRSFFVQLLGDAVVRRLLADLKLCSANVVYSAGGNFMVLGPEEVKATEAVEQVRRQVNARLVEAIQGDTALVLETMNVSATDLFALGQFNTVRDDFAKKVAQAKNRPLQELAVGKKGWETLFKPKGKGSRLSCAVCRIEVDERNSKKLERTGEVPEGAESPRICYLCSSFAELARGIRHKDLWMIVAERPGMLDTKVQPKDGWADLLARMTGFHYDFSHEQPAGKGTIMALNRPDFLEAGAHGFRLLANVTPVVTKDDLKYLRGEEGLTSKDMPHEGDVRSFTLLAHVAAAAGAIKRVGVLRMDVDGLGRVFSEGVPDLTLPKLSALSGALDLFFGGYLNVLVRAQVENDLYVIYAGGDDLFIVGAWHHLPDLAETIRNKFRAFVGDNPALSLSGGITLEGAKFPLYRAAERAGEAESRAKGYRRPDDRTKDALCFLDTVVGWEDWERVRETEQLLSDLIDAKVPRSLLRMAQILHAQFAAARRRAIRAERKAGRKPIPGRLYWDRWAWMAAYSLTRLARGCPKKQKEEILNMQRKWIQSGERIHFLGLAARWAEYQLRGGEK